MIRSILASAFRITSTVILLLASPACCHTQLEPPTLASAKSPAPSQAGSAASLPLDPQIIENTKRYHISKFEKLCISLEYASKVIIVGKTARDIREALSACYWIYGNNR